MLKGAIGDLDGEGGVKVIQLYPLPEEGQHNIESPLDCFCMPSGFEFPDEDGEVGWVVFDHKWIQ